ncbi:MAG: hypothetical protein WCJ39_07480 [bacterium]
MKGLVEAYRTIRFHYDNIKLLAKEEVSSLTTTKGEDGKSGIDKKQTSSNSEETRNEGGKAIEKADDIPYQKNVISQITEEELKTIIEGNKLLSVEQKGKLVANLEKFKTYKADAQKIFESYALQE